MKKRLPKSGFAITHEARILDPEFLRQHPAWKPKQSWKGRFAVAAWFRFPEGLTEMVQLMLVYEDQDGQRSYVVDRCLPNRQTLILLNGVVDLEVTGEVSNMSLRLTGLTDDAVWMLDEWNIEPSDTAALQQARVRVSAAN